MSGTVDYHQFERLRVTIDADGLAHVQFGTPGQLPVADSRMHEELGSIWPLLDSDPRVRVALVASNGKGFLAGGDLETVAQLASDANVRLRVWREARNLVQNMVNCDTPIVSAVHGPAVGAGLALALLADICVVTPGARLIDGHLRLGVAAGDHAALVWPLACGLTRAKYHLMLGEELWGVEAQQIGLVARCVANEQLAEESVAIARRLATGPRSALQMTKHSLNHWLRAALPLFEASLGMEFLGFGGTESEKRLVSLRDRRPPHDQK